MTEAEKERLVRQYAVGEVSRRRCAGVASTFILNVLAALGELGLRPSMAPMEGPNVDARQRGILFVRERLREQAKP